MDEIDGIPVEEFDVEDDIDYDFYEDDGGMEVGDKAVHCSGIEGVITMQSGGYYWMTHSGGQEAFIHCGELSKKGVPTKEELEAYLGHSNGLPNST